MRRLDSIIHTMDMHLSKYWEIVKDGELGVLQSMGSQGAGHNLVTEQQYHSSFPGTQSESCPGARVLDSTLLFAKQGQVSLWVPIVI